MRAEGDAVRKAAERAARDLGYPHMKSEQLRVVEAFVQGSDVFAILPTGYFTAIYLFFKALYGYRWPTGQMAISNYVCTDYVITFLQYKSRIRMTPDPCAGARSRVWLRQTMYMDETGHISNFFSLIVIATTMGK